MPLYRYYHAAKLEVGQIVVLESSEEHHLVRVVRAKPGLSVELVDGQGSLAQARVTSVAGKQAELTVEAVTWQPAPEHSLWLMQALPKLPRLDFIVEKATELGATHIVLYPATRSEKQGLTPIQRQRLQALAVAALKQCGRLYLPEISLWPEIQAWPAWRGRGYFGAVQPAAPALLHAWKPLAANESVAICIGPEAGLSANEEEKLLHKGWQGIKLHSFILRTETAPLAALALLSHLLLFDRGFQEVA